MKSVISEIKNNLIEDLKEIFGNKVDKIIIYGSYARGDEEKDSDIDVIVLVNETDEKLKFYEKKIDKLSVNYDLKYMIVLSIIIKNSNHFYQYENTVPFYNNVIKEGIIIYGR